MYQCELEKVVKEKGNPKLTRTGIKMISFVDGVSPDMLDKIIDLKKIEGLWVINKIYDTDIEVHQIKRGWHVGGL